MRSWIQWATAVLITLLVVIGVMVLLVFLFHVRGKTAGS